MPEFTYHCVDCGALLTPEDVVYDISEIAFFGASEGDYYKYHLYASKSKLLEMFSWSDGEGVSNITLLDWIRMLYEQCDDKLEHGTRRKDADTAYDDYIKLLNEQGKQETEEYSLYQTAVVPGLPDNLSQTLVNNCSDMERCHCKIQLHEKYGYTIVGYKGRDLDEVTYKDQRRCKKCHARLLEDAFQYKQTLIGFIGFQKVGKTCLIAALCKHLNICAYRSELLGRAEDQSDRSFLRELNSYSNGFSLKKTAMDGLLKVNPSYLVQEKDQEPQILTFVDIAGEAFNNEDGKFDPTMMQNNFRAISECSLYVFCSSLSAFEMADYGKMENSLRNFIKHLQQTTGNKRVSPIMVAIMQIDEAADCIENNKEAPYIGDEYIYYREYNQIFNIRESKQLKESTPNEAARKEIDRRLQKFLSCAGETVYYTPITCSAYGQNPVDQITVYEDLPSTRKEIEKRIKAKQPTQIVIQDTANSMQSQSKTLFERFCVDYGHLPELVEIVNCSLEEQQKQQYRDAASSRDEKELNMVKSRLEPRDEGIVNQSTLKFKPQSRNMQYLYQWIMRMIGQMEIPSRSRENLPIASMDCRDLSMQDYHACDMEVLAIARMFVNPSRYDAEFYGIIHEPIAMFRAIRRKRYLKKITKEKK